MGVEKHISVLVMVVVFVAVVGGIVGSIATSNRFAATTEDSFPDAKIAVPYNLTLTQPMVQELLAVTNCTGSALAASNYTDYATAGYVQLDDNVSWAGTGVCVSYGYGGRLSAVTYAIYGLVILFVVIGMLVMFMRSYGLLGSGR